MGSASGSEDGMIPRFLEDLFKGMEAEGETREHELQLGLFFNIN